MSLKWVEIKIGYFVKICSKLCDVLVLTEFLFLIHLLFFSLQDYVYLIKIQIAEL